MARAGGDVGGWVWPAWANSARAAFLPLWQPRPTQGGPATHWVESFEKAREKGSGSGTWRGRWRRRWVNAADSGKFWSVRYIRLRNWDLPFWVGSWAQCRWAAGVDRDDPPELAERPADTKRPFLPCLVLRVLPLSPGSRTRQQASRSRFRPSDRGAVGPRGSRAQPGQEEAAEAAGGRPEDSDPDPEPRRRRTASRPCRWWGWTWARRAVTLRWPGLGASRPSPMSSATAAPRKWEPAGAPGECGEEARAGERGDRRLAGRLRGAGPNGGRCGERGAPR